MAPGTEEARILAWCRGNLAAARCVLTLFEISQLADDICDGDTPPGRVGTLLLTVFGKLMGNPFWVQFQHVLAPQVFQCILCWDATTIWEVNGTEDSKMMAWAWREIGESLIGAVANILAGPEAAQATMQEVHHFYHVEFPESFASWKEEQRHG